MWRKTRCAVLAVHLRPTDIKNETHKTGTYKYIPVVFIHAFVRSFIHSCLPCMNNLVTWLQKRSNKGPQYIAWVGLIVNCGFWSNIEVQYSSILGEVEGCVFLFLEPLLLSPWTEPIQAAMRGTRFCWQPPWPCAWLKKQDASTCLMMPQGFKLACSWVMIYQYTDYLSACA